MQKYGEEIFSNQQFGTAVFMKLVIGMETFATSETELARVHYSHIATFISGHNRKQSSCHILIEHRIQVHLMSESFRGTD